jgi:hypothetical protein
MVIPGLLRILNGMMSRTSMVKIFLIGGLTNVI